MMRLYDTARRRVVEFTAEQTVTLYVCGITPYDTTHLGHAATYLTYDVLQRRLIDRGHEVRYVRNITDVDDDLLRVAAERGVHYLDLAWGQAGRFDRDMEALNLLPPWAEPRATSAIGNIRGMIDTLLARGNAYLADGSVYFDVATSSTFGQLSHLDRDEMRQRAAQSGEDLHDPAKRNPLDVVLWKPSAAGEPVWESRWGSGRPGWHIECSALALRELGPTIDLHGGGQDLIYPHHEAVQAQCEAMTSAPFVRYWLHQAMVGIDGVKMSKSTGNLVFVADLLATHEPAAVRLALSGHHYRQEWDWNDQLLVDATERLAGWRSAGPGEGALDEVRAALDEDLDLPAAVAAIDRAAAAGQGVDRAADLLGIAL
jgi:L-cysteine:1D-myo-inositol 2-amino-2-deoxy-alpha-D-glucopyranoside ligase